MSIKVVCPSCSKTINAPDKFAGKTAKCPGCQEPLKIPSADVPPVVEEEPVAETETETEPAKTKKGLSGRKSSGKKSSRSLKKKVGKTSGRLKGKSSGKLKSKVSRRNSKGEEGDDAEGSNQEQPKSKMPLYIGAAVAILLIGGAVAYFGFGKQLGLTGSDPAPKEVKAGTQTEAKADTDTEAKTETVKEEE